MRTTASSKAEGQLTTAATAEADDLIPGLPDDIAKHCLIHLPFPYQFLTRSVSSAWNRTLTSAAFLRFKAAAMVVAPPLQPTLFVFSYHWPSFRLHCQALDPLSGRWFLLPPMPLASTSKSFATTALPSRGELYVLGGMHIGTQTPLAGVYSYRAATNTWSTVASMPTPHLFFTAGAIGGRILAAGIGGDDVYDPAADRWSTAAEMPCGIARYGAAVTGSRMYVTEGWAYPCASTAREWVYDGESGTWEEMRRGMKEGWTGPSAVARRGMKEGWTGPSAVVGGRLFMVSEYGDRRVKVYEMEVDTWRAVDGGRVPGKVKRPYAVTGAENGRIYVAGKGLFVAVGTVAKHSGEQWKVEWEVVKGPPAMAKLEPYSAHILYV